MDKARRDALVHHANETRNPLSQEILNLVQAHEKVLAHREELLGLVRELVGPADVFPPQAHMLTLEVPQSTFRAILNRAIARAHTERL